MAASSTARKAERLAGHALSVFRSTIAKLGEANALHAKAQAEHQAKADEHSTLAAQHQQHAIDQVQAIADNNAVVDKLTEVIGS